MLGAPLELEHLAERAQRQAVTVAAFGREQLGGHLLVVALRLVGHLVEQVEAAERPQAVDQVLEHEGGEALRLRPRLLGALGRLARPVGLPGHAGGEQHQRHDRGGGDQLPQPSPRLAADPVQPFEGVDRRRAGAGRERLHAAEQRREVGVDAGDRLGLAARRLLEALAELAAAPRRGAGEQLLQQDAERVDVARRRRLLALRLLGAHVVDGAGDAADGERQRGAGAGGAADADGGAFAGGRHRHRPLQLGLRLLLVTVGDAEVEDLGLPLGGEDDVLGLEVAVDDAEAVRRGDGRQQLLGELELGLAGGQRAVGEGLRAASCRPPTRGR